MQVQERVRATQAKVFVSYSREDKAFVEKLSQALEDRGQSAWVDWEDIPPSARWRKEITDAIRSSDTLIFVVSPRSVASGPCRDELEEAARLNKRILPVIYKDVPSIRLPRIVADRNWVNCRVGDDFDAAMDAITTALETDLEWVHAHTRLQMKGLEWEDHGRDRSFLLRGKDLEVAEFWLGKASAGRKPEPTPQQTQYVLASRRGTTRSLRLRLGAALVALVVSVALAGIATIEARAAAERARIARSRELAAKATAQLDSDPELAISLAYKGMIEARTVEAEVALREALTASHVEKTFQPGAGPVESLSIAGGVIAASFEDGKVQTWAYDREVPEEPLPLDIEAATVALSPDGRTLAVVARDGELAVWDVAARQVQTTAVARGAVHTHGLAFSADGDRLAIARRDGSVEVLDTSTWKVTTSWTACHDCDLHAVAFGPANQIALGGDDFLRVEDLANDTLIPPSDSPAGSVLAVAFSAQGILGASDREGQAYVWKDGLDRPPAVLSGHTGAVTDIAFSPRKGNVLTTSRDGTARIWGVSSGKAVLVLKGHADSVLDGEFVDDEAAATSSDDGKIKLWSVKLSDVLISSPAETFSGFAFSRVRNSIFTISKEGHVQEWNVESGRLIRTATPGPPSLEKVAVTSDGSKIVVSGGDGRVMVAPTDTLTWTPLGDQTGPIRAIAADPDNSNLVIIGSKGHAWIWNLLEASRPLTKLEQAGPTVRLGLVVSAAYSPDGAFIATGGRSGSVHLWTTGPTPRHLRSFHAQPGRLWTVSLGPTGEFLTASSDRTAVSWSQATGQTITTFLGHTGRVRAALFSPDEPHVLTASDDGSARIWDARSGKLLGVISQAFGPLIAASYLPRGQIALQTPSTVLVTQCRFCVSDQRLMAMAHSLLGAK
jgi:WD40 repeat protein